MTHVCRCPGENHETFGACVRSKNLRVGWSRSAAGLDRSTQKRTDAELALYRRARAEGIQPATTRTTDVRAAMDASDRAGVAYNAGAQ